MSNFWSLFVTVLTVVNIVACVWLIWWTSKRRKSETAPSETTGHKWDGDLEEYNNPLPRWWLFLFYITLIYSAAYLAAFPGLGNFKGYLGWTQKGQYEAELAKAESDYGDIYAAYRDVALTELAMNADAMRIGRNLFANNCTTCHGSDGRGAKGYPNLADDDWLHGGDPDAIKLSILNGRQGVMPGFGAALGEDGAWEIAAYVLTLSGRDSDADLAAAGEQPYGLYCAVCHGADGTGNQSVGAPNLTDGIWLYGANGDEVHYGIMHGRNNRMPGQKELLGEDRVHLLAAYVLSLGSDGGGSQGGSR